VVTVANTFIATAAAIEMTGARPVFVDIDPTYYTLDPALLEPAIRPDQSDYSGPSLRPTGRYGPIMGIARRYHLAVIEDAAQAPGAEYQGRRVGSIGYAGCFSFYPGKNLGAYGGAIATSDPVLVRRLLRLRDHGRSTKYEYAVVGYYSRLDALQPVSCGSNSGILKPGIGSAGRLQAGTEKVSVPRG
jgi:dTDP-4-amino-4,6-dideoxygalactose transaminase